jgi:flagellar hook-associated protein 2
MYITGLSSGIDWTSIINEMMTAARIPETTMQNQVASDNDGLNFWSGLTTDLNTLQNAADAMRNIGGDVFDSKAPTVSDPSVASATLSDNNTPLSNYNINVTSLASFAIKTSGVLYTASNANPAAASETSSAAINSSGNTVSSAVTLGAQGSNFNTAPDGSGTITVNGVAINWSSTDSLNDIAARINAANTGATATYNTQNQTFNISSGTTGQAATVALGETSGNLLESLNLTAGTYTGTNAKATDQTQLLDSSTVNLDNTVTAGVFTINNVKFSVDPTKDSIHSVLSEINASNAGVTATYDSASGTISLAANNSGSANQIVLGSSDDTSNILYALKLSSNNPPAGGAADTYSGTDAQYSINGGNTVTSSSNIITGAIPGMAVDLSGIGQTTISVASDAQGITSAVQTFTTAFNQVMSDIQTQLNATSVQTPTTGDQMFQGSLSNNSTLETLKEKLEGMVDNLIPGMSGGVNMAAEAGLSLTSNDNYQTLTLNFNTTTFQQMLSSNPNGMSQFFASNTGFAQNAFNTLNNYTAPLGPISAEVTNLNNSVSSLTDQITEFESRMTLEQNQLQTEFANMEASMSTMKNQMNYFSAMSGATTTSSSSSSSTASPSSSDSSSSDSSSSDSSSGTSS